MIGWQGEGRSRTEPSEWSPVPDPTEVYIGDLLENHHYSCDQQAGERIHCPRLGDGRFGCGLAGAYRGYVIGSLLSAG